MTKDQIFLVLKTKISEIVPEIDISQVEQSSSLKALGINSIDRAEIIILAMEELNIKLSLVSFGTAQNIQGLVDLMYESLS